MIWEDCIENKSGSGRLSRTRWCSEFSKTVDTSLQNYFCYAVVVCAVLQPRLLWQTDDSDVDDVFCNVHTAILDHDVIHFSVHVFTWDSSWYIALYQEHDWRNLSARCEILCNSNWQPIYVGISTEKYTHHHIAGTGFDRLVWFCAGCWNVGNHLVYNGDRFRVPPIWQHSVYLRRRCVLRCLFTSLDNNGIIYAIFNTLTTVFCQIWGTFGFILHCNSLTYFWF